MEYVIGAAILLVGILIGAALVRSTVNTKEDLN